MALLKMPNEWDLMRIPYSARSDRVSAYKKAKWKLASESSTVKLRLIDEARMNEVDSFYKVCQMHRDQYRDHTGTLHPLAYFQHGEYLWMNSPKLTRLYLEYPSSYVQYKQPLVLPKSYQRATPISTLPGRTLVGHYFHGSDNSYNR